MIVKHVVVSLIVLRLRLYVNMLDRYCIRSCMLVITVICNQGFKLHVVRWEKVYKIVIVSN